MITMKQNRQLWLAKCNNISVSSRRKWWAATKLSRTKANWLEKKNSSMVAQELIGLWGKLLQRRQTSTHNFVNQQKIACDDRAKIKNQFKRNKLAIFNIDNLTKNEEFVSWRGNYRRSLNLLGRSAHLIVNQVRQVVLHQLILAAS